MFHKLLFITLTLFVFSALAQDKIEIDPATSKLTYVGKKVTGEHSGEVNLASGHLNFTKEALTGGEFEIDMTTITNNDLTGPEYKTKFLAHMISEDFFSVEKFKTAKLVIKSVKKVKDNSYKVTADLTIKNKTSSVNFIADATKEKATAKVVFDRTKFDIKYGSGKFFKSLGDKMIMDEVHIDVLLKAKK